MGSPLRPLARTAAAAPAREAASPPPENRLSALTLAAIGVVYGDIGTSPLYTMRVAFGPHGVLPLTEATVLGVLSLIFWSLFTVVTLKYVTVILRADNRGEGGILALSTLAQRTLSPRGRQIVVVLAMIGAALFYGDGIITPAITVLSAIEGLKVATPLFEPYVVPFALVILTVLFLMQSRGTGKIGLLFGPVMCLWFIVIGVLGLVQIIHAPHVLWALDPSYALALFGAHQWLAFATLGAVFLAVTGAEALYVDMGHFGRLPIRIAWFGLVLPGLLLNYFGQGALLLANPGAASNPFYMLAPAWALYPIVVLATWATVIASQAVISGVFSISGQAVQLGYLPRLTVRHTSAQTIGQIYIPAINWLLLAGVVLLVLGFETSSNLAAAYGIAVSTAMAIDAGARRDCRAWRLGLAAAAGNCGVRGISRRRSHLCLRQCAQALCRRLVPPRHGCRGVHPDVDLAPRPRGHVRAPVPEGAVAALFSHQPVAAPADPRARHRSVPHCKSRHRAACAAAQPQAQ
jgi:KUP system potassium uptake protein